MSNFTSPRGQKMWGGRFASQPDDAMQAINASIEVDKRLWREDIEGSKAHADMLAAQGIITNEDNAAIQVGLDEIAGEIVAGTFPFSAELEDIHLNIEARLTERIGEAGKRLHTGRSRNEQVALDVRLWLRAASTGVWRRSARCAGESSSRTVTVTTSPRRTADTTGSPHAAPVTTTASPAPATTSTSAARPRSTTAVARDFRLRAPTRPFGRSASGRLLQYSWFLRNVCERL